MNRNLAAGMRIAATVLAPILLPLSATSIQAQTVAQKIPLVVGLTILTAVSAPIVGDYETLKTVDALAADGAMRMTITGESPNPVDKTTKSLSIGRSVRGADLAGAHTYKYVFSSEGENEYAGTTALGASASVLNDVRSKGRAEVHIDGEAPGLGGLISGVMNMMTSSSADGTLGMGTNASGTLALAEPKPVAFPVIVNNVRTVLQAWHLKGHLSKGDQPADIDWYILDDPANPLSLRYAMGNDKLEVVRIAYPVANAANELERSLAHDRRAVLYGIYFDFNSAVMKPQSEPVLREIVDVMKREPSWTLKVEGHTDNVGGDVKNQDLSARRAASVREALIQRGVLAARLTTGGYGASVPRETNTTLAGRARNRRVELTRN